MGLIAIFIALGVGFSIVNVVLVFSPECNRPPYQPVMGNVLSEKLNSLPPNKSESNNGEDVSITFFMFENVSSL